MQLQLSCLLQVSNHFAIVADDVACQRGEVRIESQTADAAVAEDELHNARMSAAERLVGVGRGLSLGGHQGPLFETIGADPHHATMCVADAAEDAAIFSLATHRVGTDVLFAHERSVAGAIGDRGQIELTTPTDECIDATNVLNDGLVGDHRAVGVNVLRVGPEARGVVTQRTAWIFEVVDAQHVRQPAGAEVHLYLGLIGFGRLIDNAISQIPFAELIGPLGERQHQRAPSRPATVATRRVAVVTNEGRRQEEIGVMKILRGQANLLEIVRALHAAGSLARGLHCGQQQRDQDADDGDDDEELDEGKATLAQPNSQGLSTHDTFLVQQTNESINDARS